MCQEIKCLIFNFNLKKCFVNEPGILCAILGENNICVNFFSPRFGAAFMLTITSFFNAQEYTHWGFFLASSGIFSLGDSFLASFCILFGFFYITDMIPLGCLFHPFWILTKTWSLLASFLILIHLSSFPSDFKMMTAWFFVDPFWLPMESPCHGSLFDSFCIPFGFLSWTILFTDRLK